MDLLLSEDVSKDDYDFKKKSIKMNIERLKEKRDKLDNHGDNILETTEKVFDFACLAIKRFKEGNLKEKKAIF